MIVREIMGNRYNRRSPPCAEGVGLEHVLICPAARTDHSPAKITQSHRITKSPSRSNEPVGSGESSNCSREQEQLGQPKAPLKPSDLTKFDLRHKTSLTSARQKNVITSQQLDL